MARLDHDLDEEQIVCICITGKEPVVIPKDVKIWIQRKNRVHWFLCGEGTIDAITFEEGRDPFHAKPNSSQSKTHVLSDTVTDGKFQGQHFSYTITFTAKGLRRQSVVVDPGVDVQPYPARTSPAGPAGGRSSKGARRIRK